VRELGAHFPGRDLRWVRLRIPVLGPGVEPVAVGVHVELLEVPVLVERVVLEVVHLYHVVLGGRGLILESRLVGQAR